MTIAHDPASIVIFWLTLIFLLAMVGRYLAERLHQPGVLGELLMGIIFGNVGYFVGLQLSIILREGSAVFNIMRGMLSGMPLAEAVNHSISNLSYATQVTTVLSSNYGIDFIKVGYTLDMFSRFGVIFLLFLVGLDSSVEELKHTGRESIQVALIGVIAPILLGFTVAYLLMPDASYNTTFFIAATLSATSIGITARVLSNLKALQTREARTILGAAMVDDVLGLIILAVVSSIVINTHVRPVMVIQLIVSTVLFFTGVLLIGPWVLQHAIRRCRFLMLWEAKLFISFIFTMTLAWLATVAQLAAIIGAFTAGMIINDNFFESPDKSWHHRLTIKDLVSPLEFLLAPLFFMLIGIQVKLEAFWDWEVLFVASGLILAAIAGKLLSGLGANRQDDRLFIGIGMLPRGEVGLVFASVGKTLGVIPDKLFSAIILMVIVTTIIAPPLLKLKFHPLSEME